MRNLDVCPAYASGRLGRFTDDPFFDFEVFGFGGIGTSCPGRKTLIFVGADTEASYVLML